MEGGSAGVGGNQWEWLVAMGGALVLNVALLLVVMCAGAHVRLVSLSHVWFVSNVCGYTL